MKNDGWISKGQLKVQPLREWVARCFVCGQMDVAHYVTRLEAIEAFSKNDKWRVINKKWHCDKCAQQGMHPTRAGGGA